MQDGLIEKTFVWDLRSSPDKLWPILSDTARLNEALDLPLYRISETFDRDGLRRRYGELDEDGVRIRWEEPPFEWVDGHWWRWRRFYESGPLRETGGTLILAPNEAGGTRASYLLCVEPNGALGRLLVASGHLKMAAQSIEKLTFRADAHCQKPVGDFFSNLSAEAKPDTVPPEIPCATGLPRDTGLLTQLAAWLEVAPLADAAELRPSRLARALGLSRTDAVRACLLGVAGGALQRRYRTVCPACRASAIEFEALADIPALMACRRCGSGYRRDLAGNTEVLFIADPSRRSDPGGIYCASGVSTAPHVVMQQNVGAMERREIELSAPSDLCVARVVDGPVSEPFNLTESLSISVTNDTLSVEAGGEAITLENHRAQTITLRIERCDWPNEVLPVSDFLADPGFRELDDSEMLADGDTAAAGVGTIVAISPLGGLIQHHISMANKRGGTVCAFDDASVMLVFIDCDSAVAFAHSLSAELPTVKVGLDCGPLTAATSGGVFSYIGTVPETARALCMSTSPGSVRCSARVDQTQTAPADAAEAVR